MQTGENEQALRKVIDFTRLLSIVLLMIHFYFYKYSAFHHWGLTAPWTVKLLMPLIRLGWFDQIVIVKSGIFLLLLISMVGSRGRKSEEVSVKEIIGWGFAGIALFFGSTVLSGNGMLVLDALYIGVTTAGFLMMIRSGSLFFRRLKLDLSQDIFNSSNESFPQEERLLENEYSVNLPAEYTFRGKQRKSYINIINPFRGLLVLGTPGAGKSYFVIRHIITQHIRKGFAMLLYDFKYDDLSKIAYNALRRYGHLYPVRPKQYVINLEKVVHRSNPLEPESMHDITDAMDAARTIMLGLNREWIKKTGDFFVESPINFVTALIWFLRKYQGGQYCTLPHTIELAQVEYKYLFALLKTEPEIEVLINPFVSAWENEATDQLEGQIASAKISMARLVSPTLYYVLSASDFSLDINNPAAPKVVCLANNPQKSQIFGAVLSLYVNRINKLVNRKNQLKCSLIFDEFPTLYFNGIDSLIATARSNKVATTLAVQDYSQLKKDYGREQAEVIMNIVGNVISGQVSGDTAKQLSERVGKIVQQRQSVTINSQDTSVNKSTQLDLAVPASKIAGLSSGEFIGTVADDPDNKIDLKLFHNRIINDHQALRREEEAYQEIPPARAITDDIILTNYLTIKKDIEAIIKQEIAQE